MAHVAVLVSVRVCDSAGEGLDMCLGCQIMHSDVLGGDEWFSQHVEGGVIGGRDKKIAIVVLHASDPVVGGDPEHERFGQSLVLPQIS